MTRSAPPRLRRAWRGIALIEALVAVLIFCIGILGLIGLQVSLIQAQGAARYRADAAYFASDLLGRMWADRVSLARYASSTCGSHPPCADWSTRMQSRLPAGRSSVNVTPSGDVTLTITWTTPAEGTHQYVLTTAIRN